MITLYRIWIIFFRKFEIDYNDSFHAVHIFEPIVDKKGNISKNYIKSDKKVLKFARTGIIYREFSNEY